MNNEVGSLSKWKDQPNIYNNIPRQIYNIFVFAGAYGYTITEMKEITKFVNGFCLFFFYPGK